MCACTDDRSCLAAASRSMLVPVAWHSVRDWPPSVRTLVLSSRALVACFRCRGACAQCVDLLAEFALTHGAPSCPRLILCAYMDAIASGGVDLELDGSSERNRCVCDRELIAPHRDRVTRGDVFRRQTVGTEVDLFIGVWTCDCCYFLFLRALLRLRSHSRHYTLLGYM